MTSAYNLRTNIRIQYRKVTGSGVNKVTEWIDLGNASSSDTPKYIRCAWYPLGGSETWVASSLQVNDGANVVIRYNASVTSQCRIIKDGVTYAIISPNDPDQHRHWLKFKVRAAVNGG